MPVSPTAPIRDDDPPHPNYDGIRFQATTDRKGVIAVPTSAQTMPPVSYLPKADAQLIAESLGDLVDAIRALDPNSYFATFLDDLGQDLADAIGAC